MLCLATPWRYVYLSLRACLWTLTVAHDLVRGGLPARDTMRGRQLMEDQVSFLLRPLGANADVPGT